MLRKLLVALAMLTPFVSDQAIADDPVFTAKATALVGRYLETDRFSGAVLVALDGKPLFRQGFGFADRAQRIPNAPDTKFRIGSITKPFTSVAVLQLVERGRLGLDDPLSRHYARTPPAWSKITIRHLLSQQTGIPSLSDTPGFWETWIKTHRTPEEGIDLIRNAPLRFAPGSKYEYSNTNHHLLGLVIEAVTGQSYEAYMQENVFAPLGMRDTGLDHNDKALTKRALGYEVENGLWKDENYVSMTIPYAAGSLYSTIDDLVKWNRALDSNQLIGAASRSQMFADPGTGYGFGWRVGNWFGNRVQSHSGGIQGFAALMCRYPDEKLTVVVLANLRQTPTAWLANELASLHLGVFGTLTHLCLYEP
jgi:CubicO group peptidase (beta-lactamase class C family)